MNKYLGPAMVLLVLLVAMLVVSAGAALALTFTCSTNPCNGTNGADQIFGRVAVDDTINGKDGGDLIWDFGCTAEEGGSSCVDHDIVNSGAGNDEFSVNDGDNPADVDTVDCGKGSADHAHVDPNDVVNSNCEFKHVYFNAPG